MPQRLKYIQQALNNSGIQDRDPALFQVLQQIIALQQEAEQQVNLLIEQSESFQNSQWKFYQPSLFSSGGSPAIGTNGRLWGYFRIVNNFCYFSITWFLGTGFSFGTGTTGFTLPVRMLQVPDLPRWYGSSAEAFEAGVNAYRLNTVMLRSGGNLDVVALLTFASANATLTSTLPFTWDAGDSIWVNGYYPIALDENLL